MSSTLRKAKLSGEWDAILDQIAKEGPPQGGGISGKRALPAEGIASAKIQFVFYKISATAV